MAASPPVRRPLASRPDREADAGGRALWLSRLRLSEFRNYAAAELHLDQRPVVLSGPNGAGKTNLLEAISLLTPGRGLRGATLAEMTRKNGATGWAVSYRLRRRGDERRLGIGFDGAGPGGGDKRLVRIDGEKAPAAELREVVAVQWLTPRMDRLFVEGRSERRRFLDRLVYGLDAAHARRVASYEGAMGERNRLLARGGADPEWLGALEARMVEDGIAVAAARNGAAERLSLALGEGVGPFPRAAIRVAGEIEEHLGRASALEVEAAFAARLSAGRSRDAAAGRALDGPHRSDLVVTHGANGVPAADCSTGQQKALLIAIVLANARLAAVEQGFPPLLLLDEVTAHLDARHRDALFDEICALAGQTWLAGTDRSLFDPLQGRARFVGVDEAELVVED